MLRSGHLGGSSRAISVIEGRSLGTKHEAFSTLRVCSLVLGMGFGAGSDSDVIEPVVRRFVHLIGGLGGVTVRRISGSLTLGGGKTTYATRGVVLVMTGLDYGVTKKPVCISLTLDLLNFLFFIALTQAPIGDGGISSRPFVSSARM